MVRIPTPYNPNCSQKTDITLRSQAERDLVTDITIGGIREGFNRRPGYTTAYKNFNYDEKYSIDV